MQQNQGLIYVGVAQDREILVQYTDQQGNFQNVANQIVKQVTSQQRMSFKHAILKFHTFHDGETLFMCITDDVYQKRIAYKFLDSIRETYREIPEEYRSVEHAATLQKAYKKVLISQYNLFNTNRCDKTLQVKDEIENLKVTLLSNLDKAISNGEQLDVLAEKSRVQVKLSSDLKKNATKLKNIMWWRSRKLFIFAFLFLLAAIYAASIYLCKGFKFDHCFDYVDEYTGGSKSHRKSKSKPKTHKAVQEDNDDEDEAPPPPKKTTTKNKAKPKAKAKTSTKTAKVQMELQPQLKETEEQAQQQQDSLVNDLLDVGLNKMKVESIDINKVIKEFENPKKFLEDKIEISEQQQQQDTGIKNNNDNDNEFLLQSEENLFLTLLKYLGSIWRLVVDYLNQQYA